MNKLWIALLILALIPIVYGVQVNSSTEIYSFDITDCQSDTASLGCADAYVRFNCSISNYAYIDYVDYRILGVDYSTSRLNNNFWLDWHKGVTTTTTNTSITFDRATIHDVGAGISLYFPGVSVPLNCHACNYNITYDACQNDDTHIAHYIGDGIGNCTSFNTTETCDYCTPDWEISSTCQTNNTEFRQYADSNSCYAITALYADSCSYTFADCDTLISCSYLKSDMDCDFDVNPLINIVGNKIYWKCTIPNSSIDYKCVSYVNLDGSIIQTSPQQKTYSSGVVPIQQETREFFTATNGLVNPYFTTENLKPNIQYIMGVECSYPGGTLKSEHYVTPLYRNLEDLAFRGVWFKDNIGFIIGGLIAFIIIVGVILVFWSWR